MGNTWSPLKRQLEQIPLLKTLGKGGKEIFNFIRFSLTNEREAQSARFESCRDLEDYLQFSRQIFGLTQIKDEILGFLEFAREEKPEYICEIGTAQGGTNFLLSQAIPSTRLIIGIDLYVINKPQLSYFSRPDQQINFVNGSSRSRSIINRVERILASQKLDLLFIDGDHSYEGVKQDFLNYRHLVREGGLIAFHDIVPDYGTRYGIKTARWAGGVPQFWSEIKQFYPHYQFIKNLEQDALGIGVIRYREQVSLSNKEGENHAIKTGR